MHDSTVYLHPQSCYAIYDDNNNQGMCLCARSPVCVYLCMFLWVIFDVASTKAGLGKGGLLSGP